MLTPDPNSTAVPNTPNAAVSDRLLDVDPNPLMAQFGRQKNDAGMDGRGTLWGLQCHACRWSAHDVALAGLGDQRCPLEGQAFFLYFPTQNKP